LTCRPEGQRYIKLTHHHGNKKINKVEPFSDSDEKMGQKGTEYANSRFQHEKLAL
jgi:hypothetical protein